MPTSVINIVNQRALKESQPETADSLVFTHSNKSPITSLHIDDSHLFASTLGDEGATVTATDHNVPPDTNHVDLTGPLAGNVDQGAPMSIDLPDADVNQGAQQSSSSNQGAIVSTDEDNGEGDTDEEMSVNDQSATLITITTLLRMTNPSNKIRIPMNCLMRQIKCLIQTNLSLTQTALLLRIMICLLIM